MAENLEELSEDLTMRYGKRLALALHPLNELIGECLSQRDILGFGFIAEATAKLLAYATDMAQSIQNHEHTEGPRILQ